MVEQPPQQEDILRHHTPKRLKLVLICGACVFGFVLVAGILTRLSASHALDTATDAAAIPTVSVITPVAGGAGQVLVLPGTVKAFYQAPIYAQVSGYLQSWTQDIGAKVQAGQLLGIIATPGLDQQLSQAQANLATATANAQIAIVTAARWTKLAASQAVSQQDADQKNATAAAARATQDAAQASVQQLQAEENFKRIVAPFAGTVTARNTDIGALISVGGSTQTPLFVIDDESKLRVYVSVPQPYVAEVQQSGQASFTVPEYPGRVFSAKLAASAGAIDPATGTMLVQYQVDNTDHALQPGDYAQMKIALPVNGQALSVPSSALTFRDAGMAIASIGADGKVAITPVTIARDMGQTVEIGSGISAGEKIINNPPDALEAGDQVNIAAPQQHAN